ncbi:hypothetical protein H8B06_06030 [Sphingobacterium sp. DN00404]|uniref:Uncharacterized protein n=1 Tax=Sphingobacterium micropteri TaxID=2763501 RepID=A0ABR7YMC9_9SPHI|nr:hypothetical protein [Sphingobacterium micropteri]MBD1432376.1 hypothetical protein [Sphingobacterium micropteri]
MNNENFKLVLPGLLITVGICGVVLFGNYIIPEKHQFSPEIWGTVTAWMMYGVAIVTVVFLYKTLRSQQEVQKTQNELFRIESLRFQESIRPKLKYSVFTDKLVPGDSN